MPSPTDGQTAPPAILFRSETLIARAYLGRGSALCFVVFDPLSEDRQLDRRAFAEGFLAARGYDAVHVLSSRNAWYQDHDLPGALAAIREAVRGYPRVVTYGSSMGAYAALRFSEAVGAHAVIALSPQYSVLRSEVPFEFRWDLLWRSITWFHEKPGDRLPPVAEAHVLYDDRSPDRPHADAILRDLPQAVMVPLRFTGHPTVTALRETGLLASVVIDAALGKLDVGQLRKAVRRERHRSPQCLFTMARRQPVWRLRLKARLVERALVLRPDERPYQSYLALVVECLGDRDRSIRLHALATATQTYHLGEVRRARAHWRSGDLASARASAERARLIGVDDASAAHICALLAAADRDLAGALRMMACDRRLVGRPRAKNIVLRLAASPIAQKPVVREVARLLARRLITLTMLPRKRVWTELRSADRD